MSIVRVAIVTGAGSGIGAAIAQELARTGAHAIVQDLNSAAAESVAQTIRDAGGSASAAAGDAADPAHIRAVTDDALAVHGRIDILVNNAGLQFVAPLDDYPVERWTQLINVLLTAPFLWTQAVLSAMRAQKWGRILNLSSINGQRGERGKVAYCSAKHGVIGLTRVAALETAADGITVNAICPGFVDTPLLRNQLGSLAAVHHIEPDQALEKILLPQIPQGRLMETSEIAALARYLASDDARGITGQSITISAGLNG